MRTTSRLAVSAAVLGGGLLLAAPASAQQACPYPFDPSDVRCEEVQGGSGGGATGDSTVVDNSPVRNTAGQGGGSTLPFTGGEVTLIALAGAAAVGGGVVLVAAGRKRATG
jgi:hypothetical protein